MSKTYTVFSCVETSIEGTCCKFLRGVDTVLEIDMRAWLVTMVMFNEDGRTAMASSQLTHDC
jgi:hypothetical protein